MRLGKWLWLLAANFLPVIYSFPAGTLDGRPEDAKRLSTRDPSGKRQRGSLSDSPRLYRFTIPDLDPQSEYCIFKYLGYDPEGQATRFTPQQWDDAIDHCNGDLALKFNLSEEFRNIPLIASRKGKSQKGQRETPEKTTWDGAKNRRKYGWKQRRPQNNWFKSVTEDMGHVVRTVQDRAAASQGLQNPYPWRHSGYFGGAANVPVGLPALLP
ncbi:MAG: hypothetical protein M1816_003726 [Peltula sp. TS41687]|nr:MAG: hypothetical protein M1816_003726 [Peltula sp. TS41687]